MSIYYDNYKHLSSKTLRQMLVFENAVKSESSRWAAIKELLSKPRTTRFRIGKDYIEKPF